MKKTKTSNILYAINCDKFYVYIYTFCTSEYFRKSVYWLVADAVAKWCISATFRQGRI